MNKLKFFWVLLAPAVLLLNSCKEAPTQDRTVEINMDSVKMEIEELERGYAKASNARDVEGIAVYYASDPQSLAPDEPTRVGMDAIKAGLRKDMENDTAGNTISFVTTGVWAGGNYATETGTSAVTNKAGKVIYKGKYMALYELRNGKYVIIRDIWNDDLPNDTMVPSNTQ